MTELDFVSACIKNDLAAKKQLFEKYYPSLGYLALRYSKNKQQADIAIQEGFKTVFAQLSHFKSQQKLNLDEFIKCEFVNSVVAYIKSIRNEYYVASTIKAIDTSNNSYDLFLDSKLIDLRKTDEAVLLKSIQELVPSQRLAFNLSVIDGYSLSELSDLLETSEQTVKANLEKSKFNLQKFVEKNLKLSNDGASV